MTCLSRRRDRADARSPAGGGWLPLALSALGLLAPARGAAERYVRWANPLPAPLLVRRIAIEDRPIYLRVALPEGAYLCHDTRTREDVRLVPKAAGLAVDFSWQLLDHFGNVLATHEDRNGSLSVTWRSLAFAEPYTVTFEEKLRVVVEATFRLEDGPERKSRLEFTIPRIQDTTGPVRCSGGDEEDYEPFRWEIRGALADDVFTTTDILVTEGGKAVVRSPYPAIVDNGRHVENADLPSPMRGCIVLRWENAFDNLNDPFWGTKVGAVGRFGILMRPLWKLPLSHYLVGSATEPYLAGETVQLSWDGQETTVLRVDLTDTLRRFPQDRQPFGRGLVRIPLPYDRVGSVDLAFYLEDCAWPKANFTIVPCGTVRIVDDIAPVVLLSMMPATGLTRGKPVYDTVDSVNKVWVRSGLPWDLGTDLPEPRPEVEELAVREDTPLALHLFFFDNTRLERNAASVSVEALDRVPADSFGLRASKAKPKLIRSFGVPRDSFDPSVARTPPQDPPGLLFTESGRYRLSIRAFDVNGNERVFVVPLHVRRLDVDVLFTEEKGRRQ